MGDHHRAADGSNGEHGERRRDRILAEQRSKRRGAQAKGKHQCYDAIGADAAVLHDKKRVILVPPAAEAVRRIRKTVLMERAGQNCQHGKRKQADEQRITGLQQDESERRQCRDDQSRDRKSPYCPRDRAVMAAKESILHRQATEKPDRAGKIRDEFRCVWQLFRPLDPTMSLRTEARFAGKDKFSRRDTRPSYKRDFP